MRHSNFLYKKRLFVLLLIITFGLCGGQAFAQLAGDGNGDGIVDSKDLLLLFRQWRGEDTALSMDTNGDGVVDLMDMFEVSSEWKQAGTAVTPTPTQGAATYALSLNDVQTSAGEDFLITVSVNELTGIAGVYLQITYDTSLLVLNGDPVLSTSTAGSSIAFNDSSGTLKIALARSTDLSGTEGALVDIPFSVLLTATGSTDVQITTGSLYSDIGGDLGTYTAFGSVTIGVPVATPTDTPDNSERVISAGTYQGDPGSSFNMLIDTSLLSGIAGSYFDITFSPSVLTAGSANAGTDFGFRISSRPESGRIRIAMARSRNLASTQGGRLLSIPMQVNASAAPGESVSLQLLAVNVYNENGSTVNVSTTDGSFTVTGTASTATPTPTVTLTPTPDSGTDWALKGTDSNESHLNYQNIKEVYCRIAEGKFGVQIGTYYDYPPLDSMDNIYFEVDIDTDDDVSTGWGSAGIDHYFAYGLSPFSNYFVSGLYQWNGSQFAKIADFASAIRLSDTLVQFEVNTSDLQGLDSQLKFSVFMHDGVTFDVFDPVLDRAPDGSSMFTAP